MNFTIGQVTEPVGSNEHSYNLFVKYNRSVYNLSYSAQAYLITPTLNDWLKCLIYV